jgi:hypothetical protein
MRKVEDIEKQILNLTREELAELRDWFLEQDWKAWDAQIAADEKAGKLDSLVADAKSDYKTGRTRKL